MRLQFDESFEKSIKKLKDRRLKNRLIELIETFENATALSELNNIKKMQGFQEYYRVRLGFELLSDNSVLFIIVAHRKEIYKYFP